MAYTAQDSKFVLYLNCSNCLWNTHMEFEQYMLKVKQKFKRTSQVLEWSKSPCSKIQCETAYFH